MKKLIISLVIALFTLGIVQPGLAFDKEPVRLYGTYNDLPKLLQVTTDGYVKTTSDVSGVSSDTQVIFNDGDAFAGEAGLTYTKATDILNVGGGLDGIGAVDMDYGSVDITDHTFVTDGTGDAEIVLPNDSIGDAELNWAALSSTSLADTADLLYETELDSEAELESQIADMANIIQATEIDTFGELDTLVADKTLVNEEDAITLDSDLTVNADIIQATSMIAGAGNEVANSIAYTVNKGAGNDTGLLITQTDTVSPGTSYLIQAGTNSDATEFVVDNAGAVTADGAIIAAAGTYQMTLTGQALQSAAGGTEMYIDNLDSGNGVTFREAGTTRMQLVTGSKLRMPITASGAYLQIQQTEESVTIPVGEGATPVVTSATNLAPANSMIMGVVWRVIDAPGGGATTVDIGVTAGDLDGLTDGAACGTLNDNGGMYEDGNLTSPLINSGATTFTFTTDADVTGDDMIIRIMVFYYTLNPTNAV